MEQLGQMPLKWAMFRFDAESCVASKGLGCPVGTVLAGSQAFIDRALRCRKALGGALRQSGVLAAAGLYALKNNVERLADDHKHALMIAEGVTAPTQP